MSAFWADAKAARKYLNFNRLSLYCKTLPPWHAAILHANLKLTSCKNLLCNYCAQKKKRFIELLGWNYCHMGERRGGGTSFKLKCRADHPALPWLCCALAETRWDLIAGRPDPEWRTRTTGRGKKKKNNINETEYLNEFIQPPSRSTNTTAEAALRSRTSPDTSKPVILRGGDRARVSWYAAVKSPSTAVRVICCQLNLA